MAEEIINTLFPPSIDAVQIPWVNGVSTCKIYFSLSQFNIYDKNDKDEYLYLNNYYTGDECLEEFSKITPPHPYYKEMTKILKNLYAHIYIYNVTKGSKAIRPKRQQASAKIYDYENGIKNLPDIEDTYPNGSLINETKHYRLTRVLLDCSIHQVEDDKNLFYVYVYDGDICEGEDDEGFGFTTNDTYQVQIRLSPIRYYNEPETTTKLSEAAWINTNMNKFSEWSTLSVLKPISTIDLKLYTFEQCPNYIDISYEEGSDERDKYKTGSSFGAYHKLLRRYGVETSSHTSHPQACLTKLLKNDSTLTNDDNSIRDLTFAKEPNGGIVCPLGDFGIRKGVKFRGSFARTNMLSLRAKIMKNYEPLNYYQLKLYAINPNDYKAEGDDLTIENRFTYDDELHCELVEDSGILYPIEGPSQELSYDFNTELKNALYLKKDSSSIYIYNDTDSHRYYKLVFSGETVNGLKVIQRLYFECAFKETDSKLSISVNETPLSIEEGYLPIKLSSNKSSGFKFVLKRADSTNNFKLWSTIKQFSNDGKEFYLDEEYKDYTVENGVWYKYAVQKIILWNNTDFNFSPMVKTEKSYLTDFEHCYIGGEDGTQLKLRFNTILNSIKINTNDSVTTTLGSKYPFTTRSGKTYYRTFSLSGTISFLMDDNDTFLKPFRLSNEYQNMRDEHGHLYSEDEYFMHLCALYQDEELALNHYKRNLEKRISYLTDIIWEKKFREKAVKFLSDGKIKLFRSPSEGNMLVKISDVNLTPNKTLSNMIYDFSATITEIEPYTTQNLIKYGVLLDNNEDITAEYWNVLGTREVEQAELKPIGYGDTLIGWRSKI